MPEAISGTSSLKTFVRKRHVSSSDENVGVMVAIWDHGRYCRNQRRCDSPSGFSGTVTAQSSRVPPVEVVVLQEPPVGFEPTTARLRIESSTTELRWRPPNLATCCATRYSTAPARWMLSQVPGPPSSSWV